MTRGTTPTLKLICEDTSFAGHRVWVTIEQKDYHEATFEDDRLQISESGTEIYLSLTQEETLAFKKGSAKVQIKGEKDGIVKATLETSIKIREILNEEVM